MELKKIKLNELSRIDLEYRQIKSQKGRSRSCGCGCHLTHQDGHCSVENGHVNTHSGENGYGFPGGNILCWRWNGSDWSDTLTR